MTSLLSNEMIDLLSGSNVKYPGDRSTHTHIHTYIHTYTHTLTTGMERFGQVVVGPPGSGKTTYCFGMQQLLRSIGRDAVVVNMDPANDTLLYEAFIDVRELICLEVVHCNSRRIM
jgi:hypothetical protein